VRKLGIGALLGALLLVGALAQPAAADTVKQETCQTYTNSANTRSVRVCAQVMENFQNGHTVYWGRAHFTAVAGYTAPYNLHVDYVRFWSLEPIDGYCDGAITAGCTGAQDAGSTSNGNHPASLPWQVASGALSEAEHYDQSHAAISFDITWIQGGNVVSDAWGSGDFQTAPDCHDDGHLHECSF